MNYAVKFVKQISIYEADAIINNNEQGWEAENLDDYHTDIVCISKTVNIELENDYKLMSYIEALQKLSNYDISIVAVESSLATYTWNKNLRRWEKKIGGTVRLFNFNSQQWEFDT